jgi:hypothetical protein
MPKMKLPAKIIIGLFIAGAIGYCGSFFIDKIPATKAIEQPQALVQPLTPMIAAPQIAESPAVAIDPGMAAALAAGQRK